MSQDNTKKNRIWRTQRKAKKNKLEDHLMIVKSSLNKKSVVDTKATSFVINSVSNVNFDLKCASCNGYLFSDNHDACVVAYINYVNASIKSKSVKTPVKRKIWQPTGNVFKTVRHIWKPTGRTFTLVGNVCPLTRIATTTIVPSREPIPIVNSTDKPVVTLVYSRKTKAANKKVYVSNSTITKSLVIQIVLWYLDSGCSKHITRDRSQLVNFVQKFLGTVKFGNDHVAKIIACAMGKSTKKTHKPKSEDTNQEKLYLLHMDLCGPMRVESINGKKYILVIVDDYSRFTWVKFLRSKDETLDFIIKFLKMIQVRLKVPVRRIRTDNGTEFVNQTLRDYYEEVGISHETSVARSPQQNGVVESRNRTLIEAARTMLIYAQAPLFLWAEAVATTCFTQNRSIIRLRRGKTPYELLHSKLPDLSFFYVFGALCYPTNDSENLGKIQPKADIRIFIGYAPTKKAFRIYNRHTRRIMETIHVDFDELTAMASEQSYVDDGQNLIFLKITDILKSQRPDLQFAICMCALYQAQPAEKHVHAVKRIFRYLCGTVHRGLWYPKDSFIAFTAFADADHAGCQDTRRSTSGRNDLDGSLGTDLVSSSGTNLDGSLGTDLDGSLGTDLVGSSGTDLDGSLGTNLVSSSGTDLDGSLGTDLDGLSGTDLEWPLGLWQPQLRNKWRRMRLLFPALKADMPEIYMQELWATSYVHQHSIRFKMNNKKHIVNLELFRDMLHISPRILGQSFDELSFEKDILEFIRYLGHSATIRTLTNVNINKLYHPWRSFVAIINKCLTGKSYGYDSFWRSQAQILWGLYHTRNIDYAFLIWKDFVYQVAHKNHKKSNEMYYPRFTKVIIHHFMSKDSSIPRRNKVNWHYVRDDFLFSTIKAYKEYYAFATGEAVPKPKASARRKRSNSDTSITPHTATPTLKPTAVATLRGRTVKIVLKRSRQQMHISQSGGSGTNEGTGFKPGVPDVPTDESEKELSWNSYDDEGADEQGKDEDDDE
nr:retrovirus-related Pol polyprotein from transposon TNT 1-94 [Tanacetum cinerariifolium]